MHEDDILVAWGFMNPKPKHPQPKQEARTSNRQYDDLPRLKAAVLGALPPLVAYLVFNTAPFLRPIRRGRRA